MKKIVMISLTLLSTWTLQLAHATSAAYPELPKYKDRVHIQGGTLWGLYEAVLPNIFLIIFGTLGSIGAVIIVISGTKAVMNRGDAEEFKKAIVMLVYTAIGMVIIGLAYVLVRIVVNIQFA
jgi:hypothetical protein